MTSTEQRAKLAELFYKVGRMYEDGKDDEAIALLAAERAEADKQIEILTNAYFQDEGITPEGELRPLVSKLVERAEKAERALAACAREASEAAIEAFGGCFCTCDETPHRRVCNVVIATNLRERAAGESSLDPQGGQHES